MLNVSTNKAVIKGVSMSPRKVGLVASLVRGRKVSDAVVILNHTPKRAAAPVLKAIESAKANLTANSRVVEDDIMIDSLIVTAGSRLKRHKPAAMGRALPFQKRTSHISVVVSGKLKPKKTTMAKNEAKETK
jgi:large subunit ribosomal protein L22